MGIRDAANLAWRIALVLNGDADPVLLEGYSTERRAPCKFLIVSIVPPKARLVQAAYSPVLQDLAVQVGKIICVSSDEEADRLHAQFRADSQYKLYEYPEDSADASVGRCQTSW